MHHLLRDGAVLCLPSTPFPAPLKGLRISEQDALRNRITCLGSHAGLSGVCQVSIPVAVVGELPIGLSIVGARDADAQLVALACALASDLARAPTQG